MFDVKCCSTDALLILTFSWTIPLLCIAYLFLTLPLMFLLFSRCIYLSLSTSFWYHVLLKCAMFESFAQINTNIQKLYIYHDIPYMWFTLSIYIWDIPEYNLLLTNTLYNLLIFSFPKQYCTAKLTYVIK